MSNTLQKIKSGEMSGLEVPHHIIHNPEEDRVVKVIDPAVSEVQLEILLLTVKGYIEPEELLKIYPNVADLRKHIVATMDYFLKDPNNSEISSTLNDLLVIKMAVLPGWD